MDIRVVYEIHIQSITMSNNKLHGEDIVGPKHLKQWLATSQAKLTTDKFGNSSRSELTHSASCVTPLKSPFIIWCSVNKRVTVTTIADWLPSQMRPDLAVQLSKWGLWLGHVCARSVLAVNSVAYALAKVKTEIIICVCAQTYRQNVSRHTCDSAWVCRMCTVVYLQNDFLNGSVAPSIAS